MSEQKLCTCGKTIGRRAKTCFNCARKLPRQGRRVIDSSLPSPLYLRLSAIVRNAIARCTDENYPTWRRYGGRGVTICREWLDDPARFVAYLTTLDNYDEPTLVIDREDNSRGYEPGNVRFVTRSVSLSNRDSWGTPLPKAGDQYDALTILAIEGGISVCQCKCGKKVRRKAHGIRFAKSYLQCQSCANRHSWRDKKQPTERSQK